MTRDLDDAIARIEDAYDDGDLPAARKEITRALKKFPGDPDLICWQVQILLEEGRPQEALALADRLLASHPDCQYAHRQRAGALMDLHRFAEALQVLDGLPPETARERRDDPTFHQDRGCCLDRLDRLAEADREFQQATRLDPENFPAVSRLPRERFEALVVEALNGVPPAFDPFLRQVAVVVEDYPAALPDVDPFSLGLYSGVPRTERVQETRNNLDTVFIFKRNHELLGLDREGLREEVRKTVVHELAHHFGFGEDDMGEYA